MTDDDRTISGRDHGDRNDYGAQTMHAKSKLFICCFYCNIAYYSRRRLYTSLVSISSLMSEHPPQRACA